MYEEYPFEPNMEALSSQGVYIGVNPENAVPLETFDEKPKKGDNIVFPTNA